jgi:hypothetical protein
MCMYAHALHVYMYMYTSIESIVAFYVQWLILMEDPKSVFAE